MEKEQQRLILSQHRYDEQVKKRLGSLGNESQNILIFYGRAGIGKTDLSKLLFQSLKSDYPVCARLDGEGVFNYGLARKPIEPALQQLRADLDRSRVDLNCFDLAYLMYRTGTSPLIATISPEAAKGKDWLENINNTLDLTEAVLATKLLEQVPDLLGVLIEALQEGLPGGKAIAKLGWFLMQQSEEIWQWWKERGNQNLRELKDCVSPYEILERLPLFLARDLQQYLRRSQHKAVIFIDGYEKLVDKFGRCDWLEELLEQPNPNVLWVIFSERSLNLTKHAHNIPILPLTEAESQAVLQAFGIDEPEICQIIIQASGGIPLYLRLGVETWQDIKKQRQPKVTDFARNLNEVLRQQDVAWQPDERRMWQVLSHCRTWDEALFAKLMSQFQLDNWENRFSQITASPYVEEASSGVWRLNQVMQQHLQENQPEDLQKSVKNWLFEYYRAEYQEPELQLTALAEALYHGLESEQPEPATSWFLKQVAVQQEVGRHQSVVSMLQFLVGKNHQSPLAWTLLGKSLVVLGDYEQALEALETARSQWEALQQGESLDAATVELELANVYLKLERTFDASNAAQKAYRIRTTQLGANESSVAEVLNCQAEIAASQGDYREAVNLSQRALQILQSHPDTQPLQLAQLKYTAAWLNAYNNNLDAAQKLCQEALEIVKHNAGDKHPLAISCQASLGNIYQGMGEHKYQKAYEQYQLALDAAEISLSPSHPQTLQLLNALTRLCRRIGQYDGADEFAERHNAHVQIGNFEETADVARRLNNIGLSLSEKGEYGKAEPLLKQALQIRLKVLGEEHPDTASSFNNLAGLYEFQGRYDEAEPLYNQALQIRLKVLGAEHPHTASSFNNLAALYDSQGRYDEAEPLFNQALQISLKVLGAEHPNTATSLNNLALLYDSQGRYDEAEPLYNQALQISLKVLGAEHPDTARNLNNLALLYDSQGRYDEAEPLYNQALQISLKVLGAEHPDTARNLNNLALLYDSQGRYDEAEPLYNQGLQIYLKVLGEEHPETAKSLNSLAGLYKSQGRYDEAEPLYNQGLQIFLKALGAEHPHTGRNLNNLAGLYESQGRYDEAEPLYNQALQIRLKVLGAEHPDTAISLNSLAGLYKSQGRYDEAEPLFNQALQIRLKMLGEEHPHTKETESNLSRLRDEMAK
ncbi:MAG: tetratricopeptide repeat protein [Brasilonema angustatum HA4187-MV1]|jgi:tetratricopeptide (TPR) repeat protein/adenylylsulfate kinase-like enzyme|nr:tetratricopeptide repeat protein [Brasilonema angustatum HA4187-MV1]